jgi:ABC-type multidrug transport system ATPase subunit
MKVSLQNVGKRYNREWIFRHFTLDFDTNGSYAIIGANGSGKSTLLQVIAGATTNSEGTLYYANQENKVVNEPYRHIAIAAPYLELIEELSATELLNFHAGFKKLTAPVAEILDAVHLEKAAHKQIRYFSSGMKQRLKLAQAFFSESAILLLDEPTTNLDSDGVNLYQQLLQNYAGNRLLIISSNVPQEYAVCKEMIRIEDYK